VLFLWTGLEHVGIKSLQWSRSTFSAAESVSTDEDILPTHNPKPLLDKGQI
jgi:hypothetical protein